MKRFITIPHLSKKLIFGIIIIVAILGFILLNLNKKPEPISTIKVSKADIKETVSASGTLEGKEIANLKFKMSGKLAYLNIKDGDVVKAGQTIAGLDTQDLNIALRQAERDYEAKNAAAQNAEDQVKDSSSDETFDEKELRTKAQAAQNIAFDEIKAKQRAFQDAVITSPINGIVTETDVIAGQVVSPSDLIAQIVNEGNYYFEAEVDESDIGKISIGQKADISLNSYPDQTFSGIVEKISPQTKETDTGATIVTVQINLGKPNINFVSGINGQAEIIQKEALNTLVIPTEALINDSDIYIKNGDSFTLRKVETGINNGSEVQITSGLSAGDNVATDPELVKKQLASNNSFNKIFRR